MIIWKGFKWLSYFHLASACLLFFRFYLKTKQKFLSQKYIQILQMFLYQFPLLYIQWAVYSSLIRQVSSSQESGQDLTPEDYDDIKRKPNTMVMDFLQLEILLYNGQIYAAILFVFFTKIFKFQSFWNKNKISYTFDKRGKLVTNDIWTKQKHNQDFLRHFNFEFIQYVFFGSYLWCSIATNPNIPEI